jgi:hypothetical protein
VLGWEEVPLNVRPPRRARNQPPPFPTAAGAGFSPARRPGSLAAGIDALQQPALRVADPPGDVGLGLHRRRDPALPLGGLLGGLTELRDAPSRRANSIGDLEHPPLCLLDARDRPLQPPDRVGDGRRCLLRAALGLPEAPTEVLEAALQVGGRLGRRGRAVVHLAEHRLGLAPNRVDLLGANLRLALEPREGRRDALGALLADELQLLAAGARRELLGGGLVLRRRLRGRLLGAGGRRLNLAERFSPLPSNRLERRLRGLAHTLALVLELGVPLHADLSDGAVQAVRDRRLQALLGLAQPRLRRGQVALHLGVKVLARLLEHVREAPLELPDGRLEKGRLVGAGWLARGRLRLGGLRRLSRAPTERSGQARAEAATRSFPALSFHLREWSYTGAPCAGGGNRRSGSCASQSRIRPQTTGWFSSRR